MPMAARKPPSRSAIPGSRPNLSTAENPGDGGGGSRYRFTDTGLDPDALRARAATYQDYFGVASEPVI